MRRLWLVLSAVALAPVLVGCGDTEALPRLAVGEAPDLGVLRVADPSGVSLLDTDTARFTSRIRNGVRSRDWVFQSRLTPEGTRLLAVSPLGEVAWQRDLDGDQSARVVSSDGSRVALLPFGDGTTDPYHPAGRSRTHLTVVSTDTGELDEYDLDGNFEPEAFASSGESLFVIEYVPATAPTSYRVRKLDLTTGEIGPVYSVDGHLQESMQGTARVQALTADGRRLYTLYTTPDGAAFVHVLDLEEEWAHCVDLPSPIGSSGEQHLAIAADPSGARVLVVDTLAGAAEIDAGSLTVTDTLAGSVPEQEPGQAMAVVTDDGRLLAGRGMALYVIGSDLQLLDVWRLATPMLGLYRDPDADRGVVWFLGDEAMYALDDTTGEVIEAAALPDDMPPLEVPAAPSTMPIQCAC